MEVSTVNPQTDETVLRCVRSPPLPTPPPPPPPAPLTRPEDVSEVVDKETYLRLYDEVIELRGELERALGRRGVAGMSQSQVSVTGM